VSFVIPTELETAYAFIPGQYLTLRTTIGGEDIRRSYSISSGLGEGEMRVAIKQVEGGKFSTYANEVLQAGDVLQVMTPGGGFCPDMEESLAKHYLLVGAGSGITPLISILKSVLSQDNGSEVTLIYGNRHFHSIVFREELEDLKDNYLGRLRVFHVLSGEPNDIQLFTGRIDSAKIQGFCDTFLQHGSPDEVFLCGPQGMTESVRDFFLGRGMSEEMVHLELFGTALPQGKPSTPVQEDLSGQCEVSVILDGQQTDFSMPMQGTYVLDAAQQAGVDLPFSCKGGVCCTCRAKVTEGKADMTVNYALEPGRICAHVSGYSQNQ
jgi:ring-1,2-phenylacetyl-CoA epoxidase subunit PaaE